MVAIALFDFQASGDDEITFDPGERITNIEQVFFKINTLSLEE